MPVERTLVLGIGNLLMGDEGAGVHVVRELERRGLPPEVTIVDGGTGGFHLLSYLRDYDPVIMIDATMDGSAPGTIAVVEPRYATDFPRSLTAHDIGLRDLVESAALLGPLPTVVLVTIAIAAMQPMETVLSPAVEASIPSVVEIVTRLVGGAPAVAPGAKGR